MVGADRRTPKFTFRYLGPFKVKRVANANAYELDLPAQLRIHPVFNVSRLKAYRDGTAAFPTRPQREDRPPPEIALADGAETYEVESILASRGSGARAQYLVKWRGYPVWEATWEKPSALVGASDAPRVRGRGATSLTELPRSHLIQPSRRLRRLDHCITG